MTADPAADDFEARTLAFERAWRRGETSVIADFLPGKRPDRGRLLVELICLDLEYRRKVPGRTPTRLEDYAREFPDLGSPSRLPSELVAEEYRVRHRWGDRPGHAEFHARFGPRPDLSHLLSRIDKELRSEATGGEAHAGSDPRTSLAYSDLLLRRMIGAGGFGKVYVADRQGTDGPVAVKFLRKSFWRRPEAVDRFLAEAETVGRLRHPGIVAVHGAGRTPASGPFFVMDLIAGPDLAAVLRSGPVAVADAVRWTAEACAAVAHAHARGVVHCDLKPANLLLGSDGHVRVTDFGLARSATEAGFGVGGTAGFMAPEQFDRTLGPVGPAADVYGLGAVLHTLLTGRPPRAGTSGRIDVAERIPVDLRDVCRRCLSERAADRDADAAGLLRRLDDLLGRATP